MVAMKRVYVSKWTDGAINCYERGCRCEGCNNIPDDFKDKCRMKLAVLELVRRFGAPKKKGNSNGLV